MSQSHPALPFDNVLYGGDYNPEQWSESVWDQDMTLMPQAHWNVVSVPVFGWVSLQPDEDTFTFDWLDRVLDKLAGAGVRVCLATATASQPAWVDQKYPDVLITDENGVRRHHGGRHSFCPTSANYRRLSTNLARRIAERYKDHPALLLWHVNNEYGTYCWCELCAGAFRAWLQTRYGTLDNLNDRWYTRFWGHTYTDWEQIEPPYSNGERVIQALRLDWHRFQSASLLNCFKAEASVLREVTPQIPVTTNLMGTFFPLNYREWAREMDIVSWDNYPRAGEAPAHVAFTHAVMRGLKDGQPFLLLEQSPSQQNWQAYNTVKMPQELRLQSFQAMAQGADSVMYFQWRRGRGGIEKLHGAVMEHHGRGDARVFEEVAALGKELQSLGNQTLGGLVPARVAIFFDWETWWDWRFSSGPTRDMDYLAVCRSYYAASYALGIRADVIGPDADLSAYDVLIAPCLMLLRDEHAEKIVKRVENGASLVATYFSSFVQENDLVHDGGAPGPLRPALGVWVEETDSVLPDETQGVRFTSSFGAVAEGTTGGASLLCDRIRLETAQPLAVYASDFYAGEPAITHNPCGAGIGYYLATQLEPTLLRGFLQEVCQRKGIQSPLQNGAPPPDGVEVNVRVGPDGREILYLLNHNAADASVALAPGTYRDLLSGDTVINPAPLPARGVRLLVEEVN